MALAARERLLEAAIRLFCRRGFHAVGIEAILAEAGVARMSLYNHFGSKDALILAALELRNRRWLDWMDRSVQSAPDPRARLLCVFDALGQWFADPGFAGCLFQRAVSEFPDPEHPAHALAVAHKARLHERLEALSAATGARPWRALAGALALLVEGAIAEAWRSGGDAAAKRARQAAEVLLERALASGSR